MAISLKPHSIARHPGTVHAVHPNETALQPEPEAVRRLTYRIRPGRERLAPMVLIVEDEGVTRFALRRIVEVAGYPVDVVADGVAALEWLASHPTPELIMLDLRMPRLGGAEVLRQMERYLPWSRIPVIILSGDAATPDACSSPLVRAVIAKPYLPEQVRSILHQCIPPAG